MIEFEKGYFPVLCHARQVSSEIYEIYSFHHQKIFKVSKDLTPISSIEKTPKIISTFAFKQPLAPVYTDAINDIYDFLKHETKSS